MNKLKSLGKNGILSIILVIGMVISLGMNGYILSTVKGMANGDTQTITAEDDVVIAEEYTIKSTEKISNAYKSGSDSGLSDEDKETLEMAKSVLDEIITDDMSDYEKEKAVYEWIVTNISNDSGSMTVIPTAGEESDCPHGVLKTHYAVCVGYATTFRMFMQMLDIDCKVMHNNELYHSWDEVKLDGDWYIVDCYSDAGTASYTHFNMNDTMMSSEQDWDTSYFPAANGIKYNVAYQNAKDCDDLYKIPKLVHKALKNGDAALGIKFKQLSDDDLIIGQNICSTLSSTLMESSEYMDLTFNYYWSKTDDGYLLAIYMYYPTYSDAGNINYEEQEKINDAIEKEFGSVYTDDYDDYEAY